MKDKSLKKISGYAILELLFYLSFFSVFCLVVISALITMTKAFKETAVQAELIQSSTILERISREIRQAYGINTLSASDLKLNTRDDTGANKTVEFLLSGSDIQLLENNTLTGNLNTANINVVSLNFSQITLVKGSAVKTFLTVKSKNDILGRNQDFYDTVVLRGSY